MHRGNQGLNSNNLMLNARSQLLDGFGSPVHEMPNEEDMEES